MTTNVQLLTDYIESYKEINEALERCGGTGTAFKSNSNLRQQILETGDVTLITVALLVDIKNGLDRHFDVSVQIRDLLEEKV